MQMAEEAVRRENQELKDETYEMYDLRSMKSTNQTDIKALKTEVAKL